MVRAPSSGSSTSGSRAVAETWMASVSHQVAIQTATAAVARPAAVKGTVSPETA